MSVIIWIYLIVNQANLSLNIGTVISERKHSTGTAPAISQNRSNNAAK
ncbi:hypothetical protein [Erwinia sp. E_sp_B04_7]